MPLVWFRADQKPMTPTYDLTLLLDSGAPPEGRAAILAAVESAIGDAGTLIGKHDWGLRQLAYEIDHRGDAEYHLIQFSGPPELIQSLDHTLRITDGVVRFRIIKLRPGMPPPPELRPRHHEPAGEAAGAEEDRDERPAAPSAPAPQAAPAPAPAVSVDTG